MTDTTDTPETPTRKPLKLSSSGKLELKKTIDGGQVKQSFPHGRTKTVSVEVKKKRTFAPGVGGKMEAVTEIDARHHVPGEPTAAEIFDHHALTAHERAQRQKALEQARKDEDHRKVEEIKQAQAAADRLELQRQEAARLAEEERRRAEEARRAKEDATKPTAKAAEPEAEEAAKAAKPAKGATAPGSMRAHMHKPAPGEAVTEDDDSANRRRGVPGRAAVKPAPTTRRDEPKRRTGKLSVSQALSDEEGARMRSLAAVKRAREKEKRHMMAQQPQAKVVRDVVSAGDHYGAGPRQPHGRARRRRHQEPDEDGRDGDHQPGDRRRHRRTHHQRVRPQGAPRHRGRHRDRHPGRRGCRRPSGGAPADRDHHGPRRPRQDLAARRAAPDRRGGA